MNADDMFREGEAAASMEQLRARLVREHGEEGARAKIAEAQARAGSMSIARVLLTALRELIAKWRGLGLLRHLDPRAVDAAESKLGWALRMGRPGEVEGFNAIYAGVTAPVPGVFDGEEARRPVTYLQLLGERRPGAVLHGLLMLEMGTDAQCRQTVEQLRRDGNLEPALEELRGVLFAPIQPLYLFRAGGVAMSTEQYLAGGLLAGKAALAAVARPDGP